MIVIVCAIYVAEEENRRIKSVEMVKTPLLSRCGADDLSCLSNCMQFSRSPGQ
jgi:hypothetical protein